MFTELCQNYLTQDKCKCGYCQCFGEKCPNYNTFLNIQENADCQLYNMEKEK